VFCLIKIDPFPRARKGVLNYKLANEISSIRKHLEAKHHKVWIEWGECEKNALQYLQSTKE
jgi:hypothetical protein